MTKPIIIAIDGHASTGKSTLAKALAKELEYRYIDSGAMYRCVTLYAIQEGLVVDNKLAAPDLEKIVHTLDIQFAPQADGKQYVMLNGKQVDDKIRSMQVSSLVSIVATLQKVREHMVALQQAYGKHKALIMDGRDIGTKVFPQAEVKIFMTTDPAIRAMRRYNEYQKEGQTTNYETVLKNVNERDEMDASREVSPLSRASDAHFLDNGKMTHLQQLQWAVDLVKQYS